MYHRHVGSFWAMVSEGISMQPQYNSISFNRSGWKIITVSRSEVDIECHVYTGSGPLGSLNLSKHLWTFSAGVQSCDVDILIYHEKRLTAKEETFLQKQNWNTLLLSLKIMFRFWVFPEGNEVTADIHRKTWLNSVFLCATWEREVKPKDLHAEGHIW